MPSIEIRNETLNYERTGRGRPLVLVHSLGTNAGLWKEQLLHWQARWDVIAFDTRGHGRSSNRGGVTMREVAGDILEALTKLNVLPAHFVGISMGGLICSRLHELQPSAVESLVIAGSFATLGEAGPERARALEARIGSMSLAEYGRIYAEETLLPASQPRHLQWLSNSIGAMQRDSYLQTVRSIFTENVSHCMRAMRQPVRVVVGAQDKRTPPDLARHIVNLIDGSDLVTIEGAAHLSNLDDARAFHGAVDSFHERIMESAGRL